MSIVAIRYDYVQMKRWLAMPCLFVLVSCRTMGTAEWEFREFADLPKSDVARVQTATSKNAAAKLKLAGGRTAHCEKGICIVSWNKPKLTLFRNGHEGKSAEQGRGTFTLDQVEALELQAGMTAAAVNDPKRQTGRINNLGYDCTPASCRLSLYFYTEKNDEATEDQILTGLLGGRFIKE